MVPHSGADSTAWIPKREGEGIRIALAHGTVEGLNICDGSYPIPRDLAERAGLDYVVLGHFHSTAFYGAPGWERMAYSGTHEPTAFGERDSGNALVVEIGAAGAAPKIEKMRTAMFDWLQIERSIDSAADLQSVLDELRALPCPEDKLVECRLTGYEPDGAQDLEQQIHDTLQHAFVFGRFDADLVPDHGHPRWIDDLPAGYLQDAAKELASMACAEPPNREARRALRELGRICASIVQTTRAVEEVRA
jgi:hypothetical protein